MAKYKSSHTVHAWKQHRCVGCAAVFRYRFKRSAEATARSPEKAEAAMRKSLDRKVTDDVDLRPCPHCGVIQPDMAGQRRQSRYRWALVALFVALFVACLLAALETVNLPALSAVLTGIGALTAGGLAWTGWRDFNGDLRANQSAAERAVAKDQVRLDQPGALDPPRKGPPWARPALPLLALLALGLMALPAAELERTLNGWPLNPAYYPPVVGPGDDTTLYLPDQITSIKSYWNGTPAVRVANAADLGLSVVTAPALPGGAVTAAPTPRPVLPAVAAAPAIAWPAKCRRDTWGGTLSVKSSEKNASHAVWTTISVPDDERLRGKTAEMDVSVVASWPQMSGRDGKQYATERRTFQWRGPLVLANTPGAGRRYRNLWFGGVTGGSLLLALAAFLLRARAKRDGQETTQLGLLPLDEPAPASATPPVLPS